MCVFCMFFSSFVSLAVSKMTVCALKRPFKWGIHVCPKYGPERPTQCPWVGVHVHPLGVQERPATGV